MVHGWWYEGVVKKGHPSVHIVNDISPTKYNNCSETDSRDYEFKAKAALLPSTGTTA